MSVMERRLQLLLDEERYSRVAREAQESGRSVAAVIREAIDFRFDGAADQRAAALRFLLTMTDTTSAEPEPDWAESKKAIEDDIDLKLR